MPRLSELDARLWSTGEERFGMGINFLCPNCREFHISIAFENPIDGGKPDMTREPQWQRTGDSIENLTLTPSIDASEYGHWHGYITNGNIVNLNGKCKRVD